jgi:hypothetical protein
MAQFAVTLAGGQALSALLRDFPAKLERQILPDAISNAVAGVLVPAVQNATPSKTGRMRLSLRVRDLPRRAGRVGVQLMESHPAPHVEWGHAIVPRGRKRQRTRRGQALPWSGRRVKPHPFMRPSLMAVQTQLVNAIVAEVIRAIDHPGFA